MTRLAGSVVVLAAVWLCLARARWAEEPQQCCWIDQMYGDCVVQEDKQLEDGTVVVESTVAQFAYDKVFAAKAFIFTETFENGTQRIGRIVELSNRGLAYNIEDNQGERRCSKRPIPYRFKPNCVPEAAQFLYNVSLGDHALSGDVWQRNECQGFRLVNTTYLMASDYCVPLSLNHIVYNFNSSYPSLDLITYEYADVELGICDREKFFHIPAECHQDATMTPFMEKKLKQRHMMEMPFRLDIAM